MHDPDPRNVSVELVHQLLHDLSHLVGGVNNYTDFALYKHEEGSLEAEDLTRVRDAARDLREYIGGLRVWAQTLYVGGVRLNARPMRYGELSELVDRVVRRLSRTRAADRNVRIDVRRAGFAALGSRSVIADEELLAVALEKVLDNALRYSFPRTTVGVGITEGGEHDSLAIRVENTGLPIHPEEVERCPEMFWRGREALHTSAGGFGVGLWITKAVMDAHGGRLRIDSTRLKQGALTRVDLVLPLDVDGGRDEVSHS